MDPKNSTRLIVTLTVSCLVFIIVTCLLVSVSVVIVRRRLSVSYTATEEPPGEEITRLETVQCGRIQILLLAFQGITEAVLGMVELVT